MHAPKMPIVDPVGHVVELNQRQAIHQYLQFIADRLFHCPLASRIDMDTGIRARLIHALVFIEWHISRLSPDEQAEVGDFLEKAKHNLAYSLNYHLLT